MKNFNTEFNVNDSIKVKLTEHGKKCLKLNHKDLVMRYGHKGPFNLPEEDENGYSIWQLWVLMRNLGKYIYNGCTLPFDTKIFCQFEQNIEENEN